MAVNESRSMSGEFHQGVVDRSYIQLTPDRGGVQSSLPTERYDWPQFQNVDRWIDHSFDESIRGRLHLPRERKTADSGDIRY